jgi:NADP-dependent 3-hydroxy acid dehydrogenase YdfG
MTGAASGMGLKLAEKFLLAGYKVGTLSLEKYDDVKDRLPEGLEYFEGNVAKKEDVESSINKFMENKETLDIVVANAGINHPKEDLLDFKRGRLVLDVNIYGVYNCFEYALPHMLKHNSGHFVTMSSLSAFSGIPKMSAYGGSKCFVRYFSESMQIDLKKKGIDVTCFAPGFIITPLTASNDHDMPFSMSADQASDIMFESIQAKKVGLIAFPLIPSLFIGLLHRLPRPLYIWLTKQKWFKVF